jgi:hypothetical protein
MLLCNPSAALRFRSLNLLNAPTKIVFLSFQRNHGQNGARNTYVCVLIKFMAQRLSEADSRIAPQIFSLLWNEKFITTFVAARH